MAKKTGYIISIDPSTPGQKMPLLYVSDVVGKTEVSTTDKRTKAKAFPHKILAEKLAATHNGKVEEV